MNFQLSNFLELEEDVLKEESSSKLQASGQSPTQKELCSEWEPSKDEPKVGYHYRYQSWVGDYILGYDYWTPETDEADEHVKEVIIAIVLPYIIICILIRTMLLFLLLERFEFD